MPRVIRAVTRPPGQTLPLHRYHFIVEAIEAAAQHAGAGRLAPNPQEET